MSVFGFSLVFIILVAVLNGKTSVRADVDGILDKLTAQSQDDKSHAASNPRRKLDVDVNDPSYNDVNENEPTKMTMSRQTPALTSTPGESKMPH